MVQFRGRTFRRSFLLWYVAIMRMDLAFGKTGLTVTLPEGYRYRVLEARSAKPLVDPAAAIEAALGAKIKSFVCTQHDPCSEALLNRIQQGLIASKQTPKGIKATCKKLWGIE